MVLPSMPGFVGMAERVAPVLLDAGARSVVVLGLAGMGALAMRRASAAARHWVWMLGVVGLLLLPALSAMVPGWRVLPRLAAEREAAPSVVIVEPPTFPDSAAPLPSLTAGDESPANGKSESTAGPKETVSVGAAAPVQAAGIVSPGESAAATARPAAAPNPAAAPSAPRPAVPWTVWLVRIWVLGSLMVLGHVALGFLSLWSLQQRCTRLSEGDWPELLAQLRRVLKVRRAVELLSSPLRTMPMTWGLWRTRLLVPAQAADWPQEQRRAVLLHELGHARRWDCGTQLVAQIACALYWFNPLVWVAWRRIRVERERACDDLVLNTGARASAYAEHLLHSSATLPALRFVGAAVAMARRSTLEERMRAILDARRDRRAMSAWGTVATVLVLAALLVPVAAIRAQVNPARGPTPAPVVPLPPGYAASTPAGGAELAPVTRSAATAPAARGGARGGLGAPSAPPVSGSGPTCTLDATIYDVRLPVDKIGQLDLDALTRASATAAGFEKALAELGTAQALYRANQAVRLSGDTVTIETQLPYFTNSQITRTGETINSVSYTSAGAMFNIAGKAGAGGRIELDLGIQVAAMSDGVAISANVKAPIFRTVTLLRKGPVEARQPFVVLSVDAASVDQDGKAVAYIARVTLGAPQAGN